MNKAVEINLYSLIKNSLEEKQLGLNKELFEEILINSLAKLTVENPRITAKFVDVATTAQIEHSERMNTSDISERLQSMNNILDGALSNAKAKTEQEKNKSNMPPKDLQSILEHIHQVKIENNTAKEKTIRSGLSQLLQDIEASQAQKENANTNRHCEQTFHNPILHCFMNPKPIRTRKTTEKKDLLQTQLEILQKMLGGKV